MGLSFFQIKHRPLQVAHLYPGGGCGAGVLGPLPGTPPGCPRCGAAYGAGPHPPQGPLHAQGGALTVTSIRRWRWPPARSVRTMRTRAAIKPPRHHRFSRSSCPRRRSSSVRLRLSAPVGSSGMTLPRTASRGFVLRDSSSAIKKFQTIDGNGASRRVLRDTPMAILRN